ncbi:glyoxalase [Aeromonas sp. HMWF036]|uniref:VOC family protein n=1 Tax=Aeromonas TaxID=642 RepID=UPI000D3465EB|nr:MULTISPECIES: VOC family protein [unclassified Aeromonas]PTS73050.1 glyoxalase [Aeromonas sp. HMWF036]PTT25742.1 glyoxalase [Aeromonas sp. HMWF017]PTT56377.1 glyoxalase [Aeromonas sp. HMWF015]HDO1384471.1 VOC family protein [Aeromonas veronii]
MQFDHIGLVVPDLASGVAYCRDVLGLSRFSVAVEDPLQGVWVQFVHDEHGLCYELVAPAGEDSPVTQVIKTRRNVINHLAYRVQSLQEGATRLREQRHLPLGPSQPAVAFGGAHVQFFLSPLGHIVELIEDVA